MFVHYPGHGLFRPGTPINWQRSDQGRDLVIPWNGIIQAPGDWHCVNVGSDAPFPNGFGPDYPWIAVTSGAYAGHTYYIGHCSTRVSAGDHGVFGAVLAVANQGHPSDIGISVPGNGGWVEFGEVLPSGELGPNTDGGHWFDGLLMSNYDQWVPDPDPNHYLWMPETAWAGNAKQFPRGWAKEYDVLRAQQTFTQHPHRQRLEVLRSHLKEAAGRCWEVAHSSHPVAWTDSRRLGWQFQQYWRRYKGERVV